MAAQRAVKPRQTAHSEDLAYPFSFLPQQPAGRIQEFRFAAGVRAVAELLFQPLQTYGIALPVRQKAWNKKAGQPPFRLGQHQMRIALRHREKPFMPDKPVAAVTALFRFGGIAEYVRAALFFCHPHANQRPRFCAPGAR